MPYAWMSSTRIEMYWLSTSNIGAICSPRNGAVSISVSTGPTIASVSAAWSRMSSMTAMLSVHPLSSVESAGRESRANRSAVGAEVHDAIGAEDLAVEGESGVLVGLGGAVRERDGVRQHTTNCLAHGSGEPLVLVGRSVLGQERAGLELTHAVAISGDSLRIEHDRGEPLRIGRELEDLEIRRNARTGDSNVPSH